VRRLSLLVMVIAILLICMPGKSYANDRNLELDWDYLTPVHFNGRYIDTVSLHTLEKISQNNNRSVYRGITVTRPYGYIFYNEQMEASSAVGMGPIYMIRNEVKFSGKLYGAFDMSGGVMIYDQTFPTEGRNYDFMWRMGPRLIYKASRNSSVNIGFTCMHVSDGLKTHNPSYNARGISLGVMTDF